MTSLGKDPASETGGSPAVWDDGDCYVIQGWRINDPAILEEVRKVGEIPAHETVVRIPNLLMPVKDTTVAALEREVAELRRRASVTRHVTEDIRKHICGSPRLSVGDFEPV